MKEADWRAERLGYELQQVRARVDRVEAENPQQVHRLLQEKALLWMTRAIWALMAVLIAAILLTGE